jgi:hypothetical protein
MRHKFWNIIILSHIVFTDEVKLHILEHAGRLAFASAVFLGSESLGTRENVLLSQI